MIKALLKLIDLVCRVTGAAVLSIGVLIAFDVSPLFSNIIAAISAAGMLSLFVMLVMFMVRRSDDQLYEYETGADVYEMDEEEFEKPAPKKQHHNPILDALKPKEE